MGPESLRAAALAAGAVTGAVNEVLCGNTQRAFCAVRPPGPLTSALGCAADPPRTDPALAVDTVYVHADESCLGNQFQQRASPGGAGGLVEIWKDGAWIARRS